MIVDVILFVVLLVFAGLWNCGFNNVSMKGERELEKLRGNCCKLVKFIGKAI